jgi:hypothetical protein
MQNEIVDKCYKCSADVSERGSVEITRSARESGMEISLQPSREWQARVEAVELSQAACVVTH